MNELETRMRTQAMTRDMISGFMNANHIPPHAMIDALNSVMVELQSAAMIQMIAERDMAEQKAREEQMQQQQQPSVVVANDVPSTQHTKPQEKKVNK